MNDLNLTHLARPEAFQTKISRIVREQAHIFAAQNPGRLIDIACGNGLFLLEYNHVHRPQAILNWGLDTDFSALMNARLLFTDNRISPDRFVCGDGYHLPLRSDEFETIFCLNTLINLHPFAKIETLIRELYRICKPGGIVVFDYRNALNPVLQLKYLRNYFCGGVTTHGHTYLQFRRLFRELAPQRIRRYPLGFHNPLLALGFMLVLEK